MTWWPSTAIVAMESQDVGPGATCPTLALSHTSRAWLQSVVSFVELYNTNTGTTHPLTNAPVRRTPPGGVRTAEARPCPLAAASGFSARKL